MPQYELNLRDYWQIIYKRHLVLIVIFLAVLLTDILYTSTLKLIYKATATIKITEQKSFTTILTELSGTTLGDPMISYARTINSLPILEEAVKQLGLAGKNASPEQVTELAGSLQGTVSAQIEENTNLIRINVTHNERELTAKLANKVAQAFIAENLKENSKQARKTKEFIAGQLDELVRKLTNSENNLKRFKEQTGPSGIALKLQEQLALLETEKNKLSKVYTAKHPDILKINQQIEEMRTQFKELPESELTFARLAREVEINDNLYRELKAKLESARIAESEKIEYVSLVEPALIPGSPISPKKSFNYLIGAMLGLMLGLSGVFIVEQLDTSIGTIEDVEGFLKLPVLGIIPYLKTGDEEKVNLIQRLWPKQIKGKEKILRLRNQLLVNYPSSSTIFEAYRMLRTNIQNEVFKEKIPGGILLFSSSGPEEGKSITLSNLAIVFAQGGMRTLIIDADMRRSTIHKIFGLEKKEPGLCDILRGTAKLDEALRKFTDFLMGELGPDQALKVPGLDNLSILTSGSTPAIPAELLSSATMTDLLRLLRDKYEIILIDTPPVLAVADVAIIADKADGIILIYRVGKTARSILLRTKTQLIESGAKVKGIILNNISPTMEMHYGYYYQYKYYGKYYTSSGEKEKSAKDKL
jgi:tyrosine-protein kinase Etk/Wzc